MLTLETTIDNFKKNIIWNSLHRHHLIQYILIMIFSSDVGCFKDIYGKIEIEFLSSSSPLNNQTEEVLGQIYNFLKEKVWKQNQKKQPQKKKHPRHNKQNQTSQARTFVRSIKRSSKITAKATPQRLNSGDSNQKSKSIYIAPKIKIYPSLNRSYPKRLNTGLITSSNSVVV